MLTVLFILILLWLLSDFNLPYSRHNLILGLNRIFSLLRISGDQYCSELFSLDLLILKFILNSVEG